MDMPARPEDALAQPTRARIFDLLAALRRAAGTEEVADRLDLHPNGVRVHLERLREAGLVERERTPHGRGRPRDMWTVAAGAQPGGAPPTAYADLGRWLARAIAPGQTGTQDLEAAGREIGRELASGGPAGGSAEGRMHTALAAMGFQPQRKPGRGDELTYRLCNCPYRDAARGNQDVVCTLHRGITQGMLDELAPDTELADFVPRDPRRAGCLIQLRGGLAEQAQ